ncbi:MAG: sensor histidine kinase KdpD [Telmatospirillum sp.]|nr:sensor histidine kinase KdpD [Telmatospirillum sp.]
MMNDTRPDPDVLLEAVSDEEKESARGRLKIFFGAYAGAGTTYAMLAEAHRRQESGVAVRAGVVETHGRRDTGRLLDGLSVQPMRTVRYRDCALAEFDLDAALASDARLILVDELAHTNCPGSRHEKRWQDVHELLDAGFDVYTTLNVQHLDSLYDIVAGITTVHVRDTIPDHIFDTAQVVFVDVTPDDLLERLQTGKIYPAETVPQARQYFFRKGNLIALRELALRRVADRANSDVRAYRLHHAVQTVWPTRERLMVCVRADPRQESLIREGARLAERLQAEWTVVHVDGLSAERGTARREALRRLARLAEDFGADFANIPGEDVARSLLEHGRSRNATKFVIGPGRPSRWKIWRRPLASRLIAGNPSIGVIELGLAGAPPPRAAPRSRAGGGVVTPLILATLACAATTAVAAMLLRVFDLSNVVMLFLLTVVFVALRLGKLAGAWAALFSVASFDFFFVEPRWSFAVSDTQYVFTFALMLAIALVTGQLAARLRADARAATAGERRATALARVARDLSTALSVADIAQVSDRTIAPLFGVRTSVLVPDAEGRLLTGEAASFVDPPVARWAFEHGAPTGLGTQTLAASGALYLPLRAPLRARGVLAVQPVQGELTVDPDDRRLLDACCVLLALALERIHFAEMAKTTQVRMEGERLRNALLSSVSHDLKTPLTAIRGLAETMERARDLEPPERIQTSRAIRLQAEELRRLVGNLLDLARMQGEGVRLNREWQSLSEIVGAALARMSGSLADHQVVTRLPADLPLVELDGTMFERVLINLLDNAVKYTPPGSRVLIRAEACGGWMRVDVEDDGPGIAGGDPDRIFEPFTRGVRESAIAGVGLGLALCRTIVAAHGGDIAASGVDPHGTRFVIRLPQGTPPDIEQEDIG